MSHVLRIATRKGLFTVCRIDAGWPVNDEAFLGDNCSAILKHPVSGALYVALDHGHFGVKLHRSRDGGRSFHEIAVPTYPTPAGDEEPWLDMHGRSVPSALQLIWVLEAGHAEQGERLWCGTIPGGLFRSDDDGDSWQELADVAPSAFGFTVVAHPRDPRRAWFVPEIKDERRIPAEGRVVVNCAEDGGQRFRTFKHGLPQEHAYDIIYRHAMDEADGGTVLAMGSTTGSLWISEDGGERWISVSQHLPPIYAVRFD